MAIAVYLLLILRLPGKLIFRFGLFNLVALIMLLGWKISFVAFGFVVSVWAILNLLKNKSNLSISNNRLKEIINVETNLDEEIDQLLLKCKKWFG